VITGTKIVILNKNKIKTKKLILPINRFSALYHPAGMQGTGNRPDRTTADDFIQNPIAKDCNLKV